MDYGGGDGGDGDDNMAVSSALRLREDENKDRPKIEMDYSRSQMSTIEDQVGYNDYQHPPDLKICESYGVFNQFFLIFLSRKAWSLG